MSILKSIRKRFGSFSTNNKLVVPKPKPPTIGILILGPHSAGKTTIIKQLKKIHNTLPEDDIRTMTCYIQDVIPGYIKQLCFQYKELSGKTYVDNEKLFHNYYYDRNEKLIVRYLRNAETEYDKLLIPLELKLVILKYYPMDIDNKNDELLIELLNVSSPYDFESNQLATKIATVWKDQRIKETLKLRSHYQIYDNVDYFLKKTQQILQKDYVATFEDYIR
eukprot:354205_1